MIKVVIDTNIIVQGAQDENSYAFRIIREVIDGRIQAFATHQTMSENRQMLRKLVRDREYRTMLEDFFTNLQIVKIYQHLNIVSDPEDNKLIESCASSGAEYLITNDREVLDVEEYHGTKIVTPQEFWTAYKSDDDSGSSWNDWTKMLMGQ
ncbi:MAG: putative toxin-antitoxin system toxin component, PIN family [Candidatus Doudnabacteria bacterium RIFCSPHIGHO2_01_FULL_46_14]|uniref:Putative toxin-antitoxin system toxin component, PIN family n=1 Tax=Candidatus Doudnabacteria bacterium RIFCSPHIGHO2_01_FULL_46_14 TaxID=1817824 RepID=A0A1F5NNP1_9BACT|nr:MAG: putative toxin-antitoxin system toxin component, PIN family [Candidatus Doudnabacteria bacterium RIFCSPHIGHO2_01_FULL_46_14]